MLVAGLEILRDIYRQPAFRDLVTDDEYMPGKQAQSAQALEEFARNKGGTVFHPTGTCRMGSDERAVVDSNLRVNGVTHLRVIDASIMPSMVSANTNGPVMAMAWRAADLIAEDRR